MARPRRTHPLVPQVRAYVQEHYPELNSARLCLRQLDGPQGAPRYAASVESCDVERCPAQVSSTDAQAGRCPVLDCPLRCALRLLLDRDGNVLQARCNHIRWS